MKYYLAIFFSLFLAACGNYESVAERNFNDKNMNCAQLKQEINKMEEFRSKINVHRGDTSSKVALGLLFWPGLIVDGMNSSDALNAVNRRLNFLYGLVDKKHCA